MQFSKLISLSTYLALTLAAPLTERTNSITLAFNGAAGASYTLSIPLDGSKVKTNNALSISTLTLTSPASFDVAAHCTFHTVDYPPALVQGPTNTWAVGPPQTVIDVSCTDSSSPPPPSSITIELDGAADAKYFLTVPLGGGAITTNNALSISQVRTTASYDLTRCTFVTVDYPPALVSIAPGVWNVGPPQTVKTVACPV
ncbi:NRPS-like enzyme protein [Rutstroemia sp. NJR-2017a WRK4]|nr:NRPS-like enzyme protein [Rutstroemia sp. NJR-2017a WRK4]